MKYKCLKCGCEFEVIGMRDVVCPDCGATGMKDIESLYKYKRSHPEIPVEVPVTVEK